ncbi:MAG TPA: hypothetical protein PLD49_00460 [Thermoclostridium caenicola]|uniref:Uncharacterized protein n=1 Tax=Thermoclostridium caenicola TaxID=659425 RepID=A0A1M6F4K3_9FIRM|nr:hypothetical protein [Thermoclostridium caenicola]SHI92600.1 hypothetical protein SAMN05444373_101526 [Thermoclostridium caenicola]HOK42126.1 hypothetical protein [Thermoclostridium caenicola]HOL84004.1 hypothetical protein [Thermoclostridium caenicola]HOP72107.1 hypothetical protein [Thermoclostridium caenicola]HPO75586.1 hypothetical protein [Thermoclostridium caenicola]
MYISVNVIKEKSFDPVFKVRVSYQDQEVSFSDVVVEVLRQPPKVTINYPEEIRSVLPNINVKKLELEILNKIAEFLLLNARA